MIQRESFGEKATKWAFVVLLLVFIAALVWRVESVAHFFRELF